MQGLRQRPRSNCGHWSSGSRLQRLASKAHEQKALQKDTVSFEWFVYNRFGGSMAVLRANNIMKSMVSDDDSDGIAGKGCDDDYDDSDHHRHYHHCGNSFIIIFITVIIS